MLPGSNKGSGFQPKKVQAFGAAQIVRFIRSLGLIDRGYVVGYEDRRVAMDSSQISNEG